MAMYCPAYRARAADCTGVPRRPPCGTDSSASLFSAGRDPVPAPHALQNLAAADNCVPQFEQNLGDSVVVLERSAVAFDGSGRLLLGAPQNQHLSRDTSIVFSLPQLPHTHMLRSEFRGIQGHGNLGGQSSQFTPPGNSGDIVFNSLLRPGWAGASGPASEQTRQIPARCQIVREEMLSAAPPSLPLRNVRSREPRARGLRGSGEAVVTASCAIG